MVAEEGSAELAPSGWCLQQPGAGWCFPGSPLLYTYLHGCIALWWFMSLYKYCQLL